MTLVVGTAGHIDHGKTSLLRALTGIDADRLPEEQRRGMTIDVGYAHLRMDDGSVIDFVDVPGHDRLIGNMLVGAGEIDAAMLVVAADDGPRAQTIEHLGLLDSLGISMGLAVVTKSDAVPPERIAEVTEQVRALLAETCMRGLPVIAASSVTGAGIVDVRAALAGIVTGAHAAAPIGPPRLAIDRVFSVRGRGVVVTGSLRSGAISRGDVLRVEPIGLEARVREVQVHNGVVDRFEGGGRVALNLAGIEGNVLRRGFVLTVGRGVERTDRLLAVLRPTSGAEGALRHGLPVRVHLGTDQVDGRLDLGRRASVATADGLTAVIRLERPVAAAFEDGFVLRRPSPAETLAGGKVLDPLPPRGVSRGRMTPAMLAALATGAPGSRAQLEALIALHGALPEGRAAAWAAVTGGHLEVAASTPVLLAPDVVAVLESTAVDDVGPFGSAGVAELRTALSLAARRRVTVAFDAAVAVVDTILAALFATGRLVRDGERALPAGAAVGPTPDLVAAMDRLVALLAVPSPPALSLAAAAARCPIEGIHALEIAGRIVRVEDDLAWEAATLGGFEELAVRLASAGPVSPAAYRDATQTSRRYALAILEDLNRRGVLRRTPEGHVPGPRARAVAAAAGSGGTLR